MHGAAGAGDGYIQAALATLQVQRTEVHAYLALGIAPEGGREVDDAAFIALHVFEILHEDSLGVVFVKVGFQRLILGAFSFQHIFDK